MVHSTRKNHEQLPLPGFKPAQFVNINLEQGQKDELKASEWTNLEFDSAMNALLSDGYSLKLKYDTRNDCFSAWLLAAPNSKNDGWILSGRGSTPSKAIKQACYIHFKVLETEWAADQGQRYETIDD